MKGMFFRIVAPLAACLVTMPTLAVTRSEVSKDGVAFFGESIGNTESEISRIATNTANSRRFFQEDHGWITIVARYDVAQGVLILDPGERFGPISGLHEIEDLQSYVDEAVYPLAEKLPNFGRIEWLYGGHDLYRWFPQDRKPNRASTVSPGRAVASASVLVSAGHGYYFNHGFKDWRPQREAVNGILEDAITIDLAGMLAGHFLTDGVNAVLSRDAAFRFHEPSKQPYHMIAARYQLQESMPDRTDIWHSLPDASYALREYDEDIRSRPLYANYLGVDGVFHIHTNAGSPSARGARIIVQPGDLESAELGKMVLCYMKEHIHSVDKFADFPVVSDVRAVDKGENRLASMPSVIIEVGFHTNAEDAAALKDFRFQMLAMRGAAKGYRIFKDGKGCSEFAINVPNASHGSAGATVSVPMVFLGNPDFPVALTVSEKNCSGVGCHLKTEVFYSEEDYAGYGHSFQCRTDLFYKPESILVAKARDYKGIETTEALHPVRCDPPPPQSAT